MGIFNRKIRLLIETRALAEIAGAFRFLRKNYSLYNDKKIYLNEKLSSRNRRLRPEMGGGMGSSPIQFFLFFFERRLQMEDSKMYETVDDMLVFEKGVIFEVEGKAIGFMLTKEQMYRLKKSIGLQQALERAKNLPDD